MSTPIFLEIPTPKQLVKGVRQWMKENGVGPREFAKLSKTSTGTLSKVTRNPDTITNATTAKFLRAMRNYKKKPTAASPKAKNPVSRASRHGS